MQSFSYSLETLSEAVEILYGLLPRCKIIGFQGPLGAGKTTLIKKLLERCGVQDVVTSPTFTYVNIYSNHQKQTFYHFDLYRIPNSTVFLEAGFGDYVYQPDSWAFIEWPEVIAPLLQEGVCMVHIQYGSLSNERILQWECV